ncbi:hypothetical protein [Alloprevotella tannerae]|uniref:hypothetical protein n=1 Tax=Alloprevotella tannerae TaxID=76122 RepID=UPI0028EAD5CE|nr:hypothetical protein [Alloprevotella tannerae]
MIAKGKTRELSLFRLAIVNQGKVLFAFVRLSSGEVQRFAHKKRTIIDYEMPFFDLLSIFRFALSVEWSRTDYFAENRA